MTSYLKTNYNQTIAYNKFNGKKIGIIFFSGLRSDMNGTKVTEIENWAKKNNHSFLRFDYTGHGKSSGHFENLVFSNWKRDAEYVLDHLTSGPQILIGSSMGSWILMSLIKKNTYNIKSIFLIAPAPDFPKLLFWDNMSLSNKKKFIKNKKKFIKSSSQKYNSEFNISYNFLKDSFKNQVMNNFLKFNGKVYLYHGMEDNDVPYEISMQICKNILGAKEVKLVLEKYGDHRLSEKNQICTIIKLLEQLVNT